MRQSCVTLLDEHVGLMGVKSAEKTIVLGVFKWKQFEQKVEIAQMVHNA